MNKDIPLITLLNCKSGKYIYDTNTNTILKVDEKVFECLKEVEKIGFYKYIEKSNEDNKVINTIIRMHKEGFLCSSNIEKLSHPVSNFIYDYLENGVNGLILQVTQNCNLKCRYCSFACDETILNRDHSEKIMSWEIAKGALDFLHKHSKNTKLLSIGFYGGEPLIETNLIEKCIEYTKKIFFDKVLTFNITTNGTIMNSKILKLLKDNNVNLLVSLDGPKEIHNINRRYFINGKGSFEKVYENLMFIKNNDYEYFKTIKFNSVIELDNDKVRDVVDFFTLDDVTKDNEYQLTLVSDNFININYSETKEFLCAKETYIFKNLINYLSGKSFSYDFNYLDNLKSLAQAISYEKKLPKEYHNYGSCIPGHLRLHIDVDGLFRPCEKVSEKSNEMIIGNLNDGFNYEKIHKQLNYGFTKFLNCKNCWAIRLCQMCSNNFDYFGEDKKTYFEEKCAMEKRNIREALECLLILKECGVNLKYE